MGDKAEAKELAQRVGVPVVPGSVGVVETVKEAEKIAAEIGFPVLLKAVAGGGGDGLRPCFNNEDLSTRFEAVQRESCFLEMVTYLLRNLLKTLAISKFKFLLIKKAMFIISLKESALFKEDIKKLLKKLHHLLSVMMKG